MLVDIPDSVLSEFLKLEAVESGRQGNYAGIEPAVDRLRYRVGDLVLSCVLRTVQESRKNPKLPYRK